MRTVSFDGDLNDEHRLVYRITEEAIVIAACRMHYE